MNAVGASLRRKLGPLPVWGWALVLGGGLYVFRNRGGLSGFLGGGSSSGTAGAVVTPGIVSVPGVAAGNHKKKRRPPKTHPKGKQHPKPKTKPKQHPKPKTKTRSRFATLNVRSFSRRDRLTIQLPTRSPQHIPRPRGRFQKFGVETSAVHIVPRDSVHYARERSSVGLPVPQGRAHTGADGLKFRRPRVATPAPEGRTDRTRVLPRPSATQITRAEPVASPMHNGPPRRTSSPAPRQTGRSRPR